MSSVSVNSDVVLCVCEDGVKVAGVNVTVLPDRLCVNAVPCVGH